MKVLVLGSGGRLGAALQRAYAAEGLTRAQLDLASPSAVATLEAREFDVLINCAALTNVDHCETHRDEAMRLNTEAPREIAEICARKNARLIHISTDYVFAGNGSTPLREDDLAEPISVYGESKRAGEIAVLDVSENHLVVRVSWVFGPDRPSFIDGILQRALTSETVEAIGDKYSSPAYTLDIARHLEPLLADPRGGILHVCNAGACSWREYGEYALQCAAQAGVPLKTDRVGHVPMSGMKAFVAQRPVYTVLNTGKLAQWTGTAPRPWQEAVEEYVREHFARPHRTVLSS